MNSNELLDLEVEYTYNTLALDAACSAVMQIRDVEVAMENGDYNSESRRMVYSMLEKTVSNIAELPSSLSMESLGETISQEGFMDKVAKLLKAALKAVKKFLKFIIKIIGKIISFIAKLFKVTGDTLNSVAEGLMGIGMESAHSPESTMSLEDLDPLDLKNSVIASIMGNLMGALHHQDNTIHFLTKNIKSMNSDLDDEFADEFFTTFTTLPVKYGTAGDDVVILGELGLGKQGEFQLVTLSEGAEFYRLKVVDSTTPPLVNESKGEAALAEELMDWHTWMRRDLIQDVVKELNDKLKGLEKASDGLTRIVASRRYSDNFIKNILDMVRAIPADTKLLIDQVLRVSREISDAYVVAGVTIVRTEKLSSGNPLTSSDEGNFQDAIMAKMRQRLNGRMNDNIIGQSEDIMAQIEELIETREREG